MTTLDPIWSEPISQLKLKPATQCRDHQSVRECIDTMQASKDPFLAILDSNEDFCGVFTERDVMNCYVGTNLADETLVIAVMNRKVVTVSPEESLRTAIDRMGANRVSQLPVVENGKLLGIFNVESLWDHLGETFPSELLNLPPQMNRSIPLQRNGG